MRISCLLVSAAILTAFNHPLAFSQGAATVETQPLGLFLKTQLGMVAMPPTWQSDVLPGTVIYIDRRQAHIGGCAHFGPLCVLKDKYIIPTPDDVPKNIVDRPGTIDIGKLNSMGSSGVDLSATVGKFSPELQIGTKSHIDYSQSHFTTKGWGPNIITSTKVLRDSAALQDDLTLGVVNGKDNNGKFVWKYFGVGYLVTSVLYATDLDIATDQGFTLAASLKDLKDGTCKEEKLESLREGDSKTQQGAPTDSNTAPAEASKTKLPAKSKDEAKQEIDSANSQDTGTTTKVIGAVADQDVKVKICLKKQGSYSLHLNPGVPIGFSAIPIVYDIQTNKPKVIAGDLGVLHKALEKPDNR